LNFSEHWILVSEEIIKYECKVKEMKVSVALEIKCIKLPLPEQ